MPRQFSDIEKDGIPSQDKSTKKVFQFLSALIAASGTFTLGILIGWTSPTLKKIQEDPKFEGTIDENQLTWITSFFPIGAIFSGSLAGILLKQFGSQRSMLIVCLPSILGWLLILFAQNAPMIFAGRFILGLCNGAQLMIVPIYVSEIAEASIRGIATAFCAILCALGMFFAYVVGTFVSWTMLTLISAIFPAVFFILLFFIPQSPNYLISKGDKIKAQQVLMWLRGITNPHQVQQELLHIQAKNDEMEAEKVTLKDFIAPEILKPVVMILIILAINQFSGMNCVLFYAEKIFEAAKTNIDAGLSTMLMGGVNLFCSIVFTFLVDKAGRKFLLIGSCIGCAASLFALGTFFYMQNNQMDTSSLNALPLTALILFNVAFGVGLGPVPWILMAEILPQKVVGSAAGMLLTFSWTALFIISKTFGSILDLLGQHGCFWMFAGICIVGTILAIIFVPETKGRKLEDIQKEFKKT